ncbi:MAG: hypothetical protein MUE85_06890 [Microscillaceae bacterium]|jgi:hypothetical protein|nr:hypothetical protein [Microscillaceae bacterium]
MIKNYSRYVIHYSLPKYLGLLIWLLTCHFASAQNALSDFWQDVEVRIDTNTYAWYNHAITIQNHKYLTFNTLDDSPTLEIRFKAWTFLDIEALELRPEADFEVLSPCQKISEGVYKTKIRFKSWLKNRFPTLLFEVGYQQFGQFRRANFELALLAYHFTTAQIRPQTDELFIGEEQTFEILSNFSENIQTQDEWINSPALDYRVSKRQDRLFLHILPHKLGEQKIAIRLNSFLPMLVEGKKLTYQIAPIQYTFKIKPARLGFLRASLSDVILNEKNRNEGIEIELSYLFGLKMSKTYRLENTESAGGSLKAEIFTRKMLNNGKVLAWLRVYNYHRKSEGYLYIKDGDQAVFLTNFDIIEPTQIDKISLLHEGQDWTSQRTVSPNENIEIKIEGKGLQRANFYFEGLTEVKIDTSLRTDNAMIFKAKVPLDINKKEINLYNHSQNTYQSLQVQEYQQVRSFDFVELKCQNQEVYNLAELGTQVLTSQTIDDLVLQFTEDLIDSPQKLYGIQFLTLEIRMNDPQNRLVDNRTTQIQICPGSTSPRANYYKRQNCSPKTLSINELMVRKIYELEPWSSIEITIYHQSEKYNGESLRKQFKVILRAAISFDIDVSFPAGLIIKRVNETGFGNLGGVSMAVVAQFGFYHKTRINRLKPLRFGAGFLALNAFNFNQNNTNRDVGVVGIMSIHPLQKLERRRFSFPIYLGGGYFLSAGTWFYLLGPGIQVQF